MRFWKTALVTVVPGIVGEAVFLLLIARQSGGGDATAELLVGGAVAGVLALLSSFLILRSGATALLHAVVAAVLIYPLWYAWFIVYCLLFGCDLS